MPSFTADGILARKTLACASSYCPIGRLMQGETGKLCIAYPERRLDKHKEGESGDNRSNYCVSGKLRLASDPEKCYLSFTCGDPTLALIVGTGDPRRLFATGNMGQSGPL